MTDVELRLYATRTQGADLEVSLNGASLGTVRLAEQSDCRPRFSLLTIPRETFNQLVETTAEFTIRGETEDDILCDLPDATLRIELAYLESNGSRDCNADLVPDECQFAEGPLQDQNGNGRADACEPDCDGSGVSDALEITGGLLPDCNNNGVPDACDIDAIYVSPEYQVDPQTDHVVVFHLTDLPPAVAEGTLYVRSSGYLSTTDIDFTIDGLLYETRDAGSSCVPYLADEDLSTAHLQLAVADGEVSVRVIVGDAEEECPLGELSFWLTYPASSDSDCDLNGRPDACDLDPNTDCDATGVLDTCETTPTDPDLRMSIQQFDAHAREIVAGLGLYEFAGGETGTDLIDDGAGTYVSGNRLSTNLHPSIAYTGGQVLAGDGIFGNGSTYATRKRPGVFALFIERARIVRLIVTGALTPSDAEVNVVRLFTVFAGEDYTILVKRFAGRATPAPHHIFVVPGHWPFEGSQSDVLLTSSSDPANDESTLRVPRLPAKRLLYLLVLTESGPELTDLQLEDLVQRTFPVFIGADFDCDDNGVTDSCQIDDDPGLDLNDNGLLDGCEPDCNGNLVADSIDIASLTSADCDLNGVPDECEPDCNLDGVTDRCDLLAGAEDCDRNGVPDDCDLAMPGGDCNGNGIPDACDIGVVDTDCDRNGILDGCEIAADPGVDCNGNGIPDACDLPTVFETGRLEPLEPAVPIVITLTGLPIADQPVTFRAFGRADLSAANRLIELRINGVLVRELFAEELGQCGPVAVEEFSMTPEEFNLLIPYGVAEIEFTPRRTRSCTVSFVRMAIDYEIASFSADCNANRVPDECDLAQGLDFNNNGIVDDCGDCLGDTDGDGQINQSDLAAVLANFGRTSGATLAMGDVDGDGDVDLGDLAFVLFAFGQSC